MEKIHYKSDAVLTEGSYQEPVDFRMINHTVPVVGLLLLAMLFAGVAGCTPASLPGESDLPGSAEISQPGGEAVALPEPVASDLSMTEALYRRVSNRNFSDAALDLSQVGSLLWAGGGVGVDGVTGASRTAPSAGAAYPLDIYLAAGRVEGLEPGVYRYDHLAHALLPVVMEDIRGPLAGAALGQEFIAGAPASVILVAHYERTTARYGKRGERYVHMDAGYASQNIYLQAEALGLGTVAVGAFDDAAAAALLSTTGEPLLIMPVGRPGS